MNSTPVKNAVTKQLVKWLERLGVSQTVVKQYIVGTEFPDVPIANYDVFQQAYQKHPWVFACVRVVSDNGAQPEIGAFRRRVVGNFEIKEPWPDHPLTRLFRRPNQIMGLSSFDLKKNAFGYCELAGNTYWFIWRDPRTGIAQALTPLRPDRVEIVPDKKKYIAGYMYRVDGETYSFKSQDVMHIKYFNAYNDYYGLPTLRSGWNTVLNDQYAQQYNINFYKNGARPGGVLAYDQRLTDEDYKRLREEWKKGHSGVDNAHKIAILEKGAKWQNLGISQVDMDFIESRKLNREELAGIFGVPPVLINSYEHANYNTAKTQAMIFWRFTMMPKMQLFKHALNENIDKLMGPVATNVRNQDMFLDWDLTTVWALQEELQEQIVSHTHLVNNGIMNHNEVRARFYNLGPYDGGDIYFRPAGQVPVDDISEPPSPDNGQEEENPSALSVPRNQIKLVVDNTKIVRINHWKAFLINSDYYEARFRSLIDAILKDQKREVLRRLYAYNQRGAKQTPQSEIDIESVLFDLEKAKETTSDASEGLYEKMIKTGGNRGMTLATVGAMFDTGNPRARKMLLDRTNRIKDINETTWNALKKSLVEGMTEGENIVQFASRVEEVMGAQGQRKYTIARTEVIGTLNGAIEEGFRQSDVVQMKEWLTAEDENVRDSHAELDGTQVPLEQTFGDDAPSFEPPAIQFPGDPSGSPHEVINCRCTMLPVLEG